MRKLKILIGLLILLATVSLNEARAQDQLIQDIGIALETSSARELVKHIGSSVKLQIGEESQTLNKSQAEIAFREFFNRNEAESFDFIHRGSVEGSIYQLGKYATRESSFRTYILLKEENGNFYISTISFSKE